MPNENETIDQIIQALTDVCALLRTLKVKPKIEPASLQINKYKRLIFKDSWPQAVPGRLLPNLHSDRDRVRYAARLLDVVLERDIQGKNFLVLGCGSGDTVFAAGLRSPALCVGYDHHPMGWDRFPGTPGRVFTSDLDRVRQHSYDAILLDGRLDADEDPQSVLELARTLLSESGHVYVVGRPWSGRAGMGGHNVRVLNKAFAHLFLSDTELASFGCRDLPKKRVFQVETYRELFQEFFKVRREKPYTAPVEKIFSTPALASHLADIYGTSETPVDRLAVTSVVYTLELP